jgi:hypothetical protein
MTAYIVPSLRRLVIERASQRCEYCLLHRNYGITPHEVDHIYAQKHGGQTNEENLCLSCFECNRYKGSDICSLDPLTGEVVALFHPRREQWSQHFAVKTGVIEPLTPQGRVTVRLLRLNDEERVLERHRLITLKRYP